MAASTEPTDTNIAMNQSTSPLSTSAIIIATAMEESKNPTYEPGHRFKSVPGDRVSCSSLSMSRNPSFNGSEFSIHLEDKNPHDKERHSSQALQNIISTTDREQTLNSSTKPQNIFKRMISHVSHVSFTSEPQTTPMNSGCSSKNVAGHSLSRREVAEIQLHALLNDPEKSLPTFGRGTGIMSLEEVSKQLNTHPFVIERLLNVLYSMSSNSDSSSMSRNNVIKLTRVLNSTMSVRALLFFMMLDEDNDNHLTGNEFAEFLKHYFTSIPFNTNRLQEAIELLLQRFHLHTKTFIDFEEFHSIVVEDSALLGSFSQFTVSPTWFLEISPPRSRSNFVQRCCDNLCWRQMFYDTQKSKLTPEYLNNNLARVILLILYILVSFALFLYATIYRSTITKSNVLVVIARICGILLNFNCTLLVVLMLKQTILFIRSNEVLRRFIPIDDHIDFHKYIGRFVTLLAILHTIVHMINFGRLQVHSKYSWATFMFTTIPDIGWIGGFAPLSGLVLCVVLATIVICSMEWTRRKGYFEIFYWTHRLHFLFFLFLIIHAKNFWKWVIGPLSWFFLEKLYSFLTRYSSRNGRTYLHSVTIEQSNVISLNIHRPKNFTFKPGDYITINLPSVAFYEFHPFTISSAPEETDILRVHIEASGNWTKRLYKRFRDISENEDGHEIDVEVHREDQDLEIAAVEVRNKRQNDNESNGNQIEVDNGSTRRAKKEVVIVNGPYSSCARYIFDCKHVVLISGGIGVTPYASILSSLMAQIRASRTICRHCQGTNYDKKFLAGNHRLKKIDFIWVSRDHKSFEWFLKLLHQFEKEQDAYLALHPDESRFLSIQLYFTKMKNDEYIGHYPLELITQVWAEVNGGDIFTGLKARTHIGRPKWDNIFSELHSGENTSTTNDVNIFFCGPSAMGKTIRESCTRHNFHFYEEKF